MDEEVDHQLPAIGLAVSVQISASTNSCIGSDNPSSDSTIRQSDSTIPQSDSTIQQCNHFNSSLPYSQDLLTTTTTTTTTMNVGGFGARLALQSLLIAIVFFAQQSAAKRKLCGASLQSHLIRVCTFAYERTPCFSSKFPTSNSVRSSGARAFSGIANKCCEQGCTVLDMRATCCFKLSCLRRCYPNSGYGRRIKNDEAVKIV